MLPTAQLFKQEVRTNPTDDTTTIRQYTVIGTKITDVYPFIDDADEDDKIELVRRNTHSNSTVDEPGFKVPSQLSDLHCRAIQERTTIEAEAISILLMIFDDFSRDENDLGFTQLAEHRIETDSNYLDEPLSYWLISTCH